MRRILEQAKTLDELLLQHQLLEPKRCLIISEQAKNTGFTPWYRDSYGFWTGLVRWYGKNNSRMNIDKRKGDKRMWKEYKIMPILPKQHPLRQHLDQKEKKINE